MKNACKKIAGVLKMIFGYGIMISLFAGGLTFSKLVGLTKAGTPSTPGTGDSAPETGDLITAVVALLAISGTGITVLKKRS